MFLLCFKISISQLKFPFFMVNFSPRVSVHFLMFFMCLFSAFLKSFIISQVNIHFLGTLTNVMSLNSVFVELVLCKIYVVLYMLLCYNLHIYRLDISVWKKPCLKKKSAFGVSVPITFLTKKQVTPIARTKMMKTSITVVKLCYSLILLLLLKYLTK